MFLQLFRRPASSRVAPRRARRPAFDDLEGRQLLSLGAEFPINTITAGTQSSPVTASSSNGSSVAVWVDDINGTADVVAQRFNAQHAQVGSEMLIAGQIGFNMTQPSVAMNANGNFVVSWTQTPNGGNSDIIAQEFNPNGVAINGLVPVGVGTFEQTQSSVAMDANGDFVVAYTRDTNNTTNNVFAKLYNSSSQLVDVISFGGPSNVESSPSVAMAPNGQFDVAYQFLPNTSTVDIFTDRFTANGTILGQSVIASGPSDFSPSIAMDNHGNAVIAYQQWNGNNWDIEAVRLSNAGVQSGVIPVANSVANETQPSVALEGEAGAFVVAYESNENVNVTEVNSSNVVISTQTAGALRFQPHVSINAQNEYMLVYTVNTTSGTNIAGRFALL